MKEFHDKRDSVIRNAANGVTTVITRFGKEIARVVPALVVDNETEIEEEFEELWKVFPKRIKRKRAYETFRELKKDVRIMADQAIRDQLRWPENTGLNVKYEFCPELESWLNDERWTDEPPIFRGHPPEKTVQQIVEELRSKGLPEEMIKKALNIEDKK